MASEPYISPYTVDERTRRSVMAAQENRSIAEVHERASRNLAPFVPDFDFDSFSGAVATITVVVEGVCFKGVGGWEGEGQLVPERPRGASTAPIYLGTDRATLSLYDPLENLEYMFEKFLRGVDAWATKPKYFKEVTRPFIVRTIENSTSEASTAKKIRKELDFVGPIGPVYVSSFETFSSSLEEPILELRTLGEFIGSILKEGDEISPPGIGHDSPPGKSTLPKSPLSAPSSHFAKTLHPATEADGSHRSAEMKSASTIPTSSYFSKILNSEPAAQGPTSGHVKTESAASQLDRVSSTGFEDLMQAAGFASGSNKKSPSPTHEPERKSTMDPQYPGSPSYSPPPSPSASVNALVEQFSVPWIKAEVPSQDESSSILLQPSTLHQTKPSTAPPGTPKWKIDLSERKGHQIHNLHVGPEELHVLARCLLLVHSATRKGEECMRVIIKMKNLAAEMEQEYKQWDDFCMDLEDNVSIDEKEAKAKRRQEFGYTKADKEKHSGKAKDPAIYGASTHGRNALFGTGGDPRDYGRVGPRAPHNAWGHRKLDLPSPKAKTLLRRPPSADDYDPDETEDDEGYRGAPRRFGTGSQASTVRRGSPMSGVSRRSDGSQGLEEVTNFEEAFYDDEGEDQEMLDMGGGEGKEQGEEEENAGNKGGGAGDDVGGEANKEEKKKGAEQLEKVLTTPGGRRIGLYGEDL